MLKELKCFFLTSLSHVLITLFFVYSPGLMYVFQVSKTTLGSRLYFFFFFTLIVRDETGRYMNICGGKKRKIADMG